MNLTALGSDSRLPRLGYVVKVFPRLSETFVVNEVRALEQLGAAVSLFSLHHNPASVAHGILGDLRHAVRFVEDGQPEESQVAAARKLLARTLSVPAERQAAALPRKYVRLALRLAELIEANAIEHVHAHFASRSGHVAALAAALSGRPFSLTAHAKDIYHRDVDRDLLRWKLGLASFVVTVTEYNRTYLRELVHDLPGLGERIFRLYNGVDIERFRPAPLPASEPPLLLAIGRLVQKKGFAVLVDACAIASRQGGGFRCEIVGGGELAAELQQRISAARLDEVVTLVGERPTEWVSARLREACAVVLPCVVGEDGNVDALPTVLLEAAASGRAAISTRLSGIPEIVVHGQTGLLVAPGDAAELATAIRRLLSDRDGAEAMGAAARRRAEELFDLRRNVAQLADLFRVGWRS